jgi:hypothetical protein
VGFILHVQLTSRRVCWLQVSRLVYQLALQETRAAATLPSPVLEVLIRSADHEPEPDPAHRYQGTYAGATSHATHAPPRV